MEQEPTAALMLQKRERAACCGDVGTREERGRMDGMDESRGFAGLGFA